MPNLTHWIILALGVVSTAAVGLLQSPPPIEAAVIFIGQHQCAPNEGLAQVEMSSRGTGGKFTFTCRNSAKFMNQTIDKGLEIPVGPNAPLTMKELKR